MTERHYAAPAAVHNVKIARVGSLLDGGPGPEEVADEMADADLHKCLQKLDRSTLARLLDLASREGSRGRN